ncbi:hypoxanthine-guanine phosphoribosyltransferase [Diatrype stigma]|uniref:Hypoxanthine-guanine phosphoribosyltransferase n=1 Tax=Diatrype stigma TaxID=117547 RepID=A0AAN9YQU2_9PEZI
MVEKLYVTYNDFRDEVVIGIDDPPYQVHKLCQEAAPNLLSSFQPQLIIAIGGGGYVPARILRSFLKQPGCPNIPIQAIGLSLYEELPMADTDKASNGVGAVDKIGTKVTRTQWLDFSSLGEMKNLVGKRILIVDEVDDTRTTLEYAVKELEKDVEAVRQQLGGEGEKTQFSIFVLHFFGQNDRWQAANESGVQNKDKKKKGTLSAEMMAESRYVAARTVGDVWICYPWEAKDIDEHDEEARKQKASKNGSS